ncbi:short-chain dehydrogenase/reductase SDR [Actinobaculum suis]|uniref:Short-chain dehydrogenase/reductase SDR n=1 Tax=Actinobaculum suis TaxID=1657 RepID=A0A1B9BER0_9ACTO|nr:glucose 1-dehydrogenase [Actinobaculum suis]OCA95741.1 3-alpha-hydroxysteroid dehydrogenase [Actinobaculum suis]OCA95961.1 3-alpha-hydroxysteroid dehydrogenase [Actinobaculum suis]VDG77011.1 short-chain dehydrogenase/reductase SDR [Actinobaculum suis]
MAQGRVANKVAVITGGASGMGASHAKVLAQEGARVVIADISEEAGKALATEIGEDKAMFVQLDVTSFDSWEKALATVKEKFGKIDVLVNNAGIFSRGSALEADVAEFRRTIDIDLVGVFLGMKAAIPYLQEAGGGSIINVSSIAGVQAIKNRAAYAAAKFGVRGLTKEAALSFGKDGIRTNAILPGSVETPLTAGLKRGIGQIPAGRVAKPEEISYLVVYLASDESKFVNGADILIDGGEVAGNNLREDA